MSEIRDQRLQLSERSLLALHLILSGIGLLAVSKTISNAIFDSIYGKPPLLVFNDWAQYFFYFDKPRTTIYYCLTLVIVVLYGVMSAALIESDKKHSPWISMLVQKPWRWALYIFVLFILNRRMFYITNELFSSTNFALILTSAWILLFMTPFYVAVVGDRSVVSRFLNSRTIGSILLALMVAFMVQSFAPFLGRNPLIINEYLDIPEYTRVGNTYVKNSTYINDHNLFGTKRYDPDIPVDNSRAAQSTQEQLILPDRYSSMPSFLPYMENCSHKYLPEKKSDSLVCSNAIKDEDLMFLYEMANHGEEQSAIAKFIHSRNMISTTLRKKIFNADELRFYRDNLYELKIQFGGYIFHHNNFVLAPILEYMLGKPRDQISPQYGWFYMLLVKTLLVHSGGISFENYFRVVYLFYPLYYLSFIVLLFFLFKRLDYVLLATALVFGSIYLLGYQDLGLAPGFNPIRHFFDIYVVACIYQYARKNKPIFFALAFLFAALSIMMNKEFGLFNLLALTVTMTVYFAVRYRRIAYFHFLALTVSFICGLALYCLIPSGKNGLINYYLLGVGTARMIPEAFSWIFVSVVLLYCLFLNFFKETMDPHVFPGLFLFFYCQASLVYYVWNPAPNHLVSFMPLLLLMFTVVLYLLLQHPWISKYQNSIVRGLVLGTLFLFYIPMAIEFHGEKVDYDHVFSSHKVFEWNFKMAHIRSTADPKYFANSIDLIKKYSPDSASIFILSKYDNLLPFLSEKYSAMPFIDLSWYLVTPEETEQSVETIRRMNPKYLFVDTDIERSLDEEVVSDNYPMSFTRHDESLSRVERLSGLRKVFDRVKEDYTPIDAGLLITVYQLKSSIRR